VSNSLAIAAVTATLRNLIIRGVSDLPNGNVTTRPLDKARQANSSADQINLFLYHTMPNAAWRNLDMPRQVRPGETAAPPLALNLYYLVTAYGQNDDETQSHRWLGKAMSVLHDHPLLGAAEIQAALQGNDLADQIERIRITPQPLSLEEMSKLWTAFQVQYRISTAYEVTVVLIDSTREVTAALPVLRRGTDDKGAYGVASPSPSITSVLPDVQPPGVQPSGELGDDLIISGDHIESDGVEVRFTRQPLPAPPADPETVTLQPLPGGDENQIKVSLLGPDKDPTALAKWAPGFYNVSLVVKTPNLPAWTTNEVPFALAPTITVEPTSAHPGDINLKVTCVPRLREGQRVLLLFGSRQIPAQAISTPDNETLPSILSLLVPAVSAGKYVVRLRVDGVDSLPITRTGTPPTLSFDPAQTVEVT
jgi:hypothetical protein